VKLNRGKRNRGKRIGIFIEHFEEAGKKKEGSLEVGKALYSDLRKERAFQKTTEKERKRGSFKKKNLSTEESLNVGRASTGAPRGGSDV